MEEETRGCKEEGRKGGRKGGRGTRGRAGAAGGKDLTKTLEGLLCAGGASAQRRTLFGTAVGRGAVAAGGAETAIVAPQPSVAGCALAILLLSVFHWLRAGVDRIRGTRLLEAIPWAVVVDAADRTLRICVSGSSVGSARDQVLEVLITSCVESFAAEHVVFVGSLRRAARRVQVAL